MTMTSKPVFKFIFSIFLTLAYGLFSQASEEKHIVLLIGFIQYNDMTIDILELQQEKIEKQLGDKYRVELIFTTGPELLPTLLPTVFKNGTERISHLILFGHGGHRHFTINQIDETGQLVKKYDIDSNSETVNLSMIHGLNSNFGVLSAVNSSEGMEQFINDSAEEAHNHFSSLHGRYTDDVQVICSSCKFFESNIGSATKKTEALAKILGVTSGSLFAPFQKALQSVSILKPFWKYRTLPTKATVGINQFSIPLVAVLGYMANPYLLLAYLIYPTTYLGAHIFFNHGFRLNISNGKPQSVHKSTLSQELKLIPKSRSCRSILKHLTLS